MRHHDTVRALSLPIVRDPIPLQGKGGRSLDDRIGELRAGRPWERRGREPGELGPAPRNACLMVITWAPGRRAVRVRCRCMAEVRTAARYHIAYDHLADVLTLAEARAAWDAHRVELATWGPA